MSHNNCGTTTFVDHATGLRAGSLPFPLPSLREGMSVKLLGGSRDHHFIVKSWDYEFSGEENRSGLIVQVEVL
jgi:hypothetical protein